MPAPAPSAQTLIPARVKLYLAPVGTAAPATAETALGAGWVAVGLTTPDSMGFNTEPEFGEVRSHQSDFPTRRFQTSDAASLSVDLQQWNPNNIKSVYGGGTITEVTAGSGQWKYTPPAVGGRRETAALLDVIDGTKIYRWVYPRTMQIEGVQNEFNKGQESKLPLRLAILGDDGVDPWYFLTNDPSFAA